MCADAKPSIQAGRRIHPTMPPAPRGGQLVDHEYERLGAVTYLDAWDVRRGRIMGYSVWVRPEDTVARTIYPAEMLATSPIVAIVREELAAV